MSSAGVPTSGDVLAARQAVLDATCRLNGHSGPWLEFQALLDEALDLSRRCGEQAEKSRHSAKRKPPACPDLMAALEASLQ